MNIKSIIFVFILLLMNLLWSDIEIYSDGITILKNDAQILVKGSWFNSGLFNSPSGTVIMNGSNDATITGNGGDGFYELLINKLPSGILNLNSSIDVNSILTVENGSINTLSNMINMGENGYVVALPSDIVGDVIGYPVDVGTSSYDNSILGVNLTAGNDIGNLEILLFVTPTGLTHFQTIKNRWTLTSDNSPVGRDLTLSWDLSEDNGVDLNNLQAWCSPDDGTTWFAVGAPGSANSNPRSLTIENITSFSDWTIGESIFTTSTEAVDFGVCTVLSTQTQQVTITNVSSSTISGTVSISPPYVVAIHSDEADVTKGKNEFSDLSHEDRRKIQQDDLRNTIPLNISSSGSVILDDENLLFSFSSSGNPSKEIPVTGSTTASPQISVTPVSIAYGDVNVGESATEQFTIENAGFSTLTGDITTPTDYSVAEATDSRNTISYSIPAGGSITYDLTFSPSTSGVHSGDVTITHNAGGDNETVAVSGTGVIGDPIIITPLGSMDMIEDLPDNSINLNDVFEEPYGNPMTFSYSNNVNITVDINQNGQVTLTPLENWSGFEAIYFHADNSVYERINNPEEKHYRDNGR
ncbi:choice-of-anchor D domain-containing protein, partial [Candidatus Cloacimonadota bacterium]